VRAIAVTGDVEEGKDAKTLFSEVSSQSISADEFITAVT
jgi:hypothetical protein